VVKFPVVVTLCALAIATSAHAQDPQSMLNYLIQREVEQDQLRQENEMRRLEIERLDLEQQLGFRRATDDEIMHELSRYCPTGEPPCSQAPPDALLREAAQRGLIHFRTAPQLPRRPAMECVTIGDGDGGGFTDCY
jgi:hypothetical protein